MKLVFYSVVLNHHQAPVADEFYKLLGNEYCFVELNNLGDTKGATDDYSKRPYLLRAWESPESHDKAMELACTAECCVFAGTDALLYETERMKLGLLSFEMGERWLKHGIKSFASPRLWQWLKAYYLGGWKNKPLYKLCCSAFCASDHYKIGTFIGKCYKWGYFTSVPEDVIEGSVEEREPVRLMWCARFINWKHPELPIMLAEKLKNDGFEFSLDMYGDGAMRKDLVQKTNELGLFDYVKYHGNVPNDQIHQAMREHDIFLFTSDRGEGWGVVANEAMTEGCLLIGSDEIGAVPYLVNDGDNGLIFKSNNLQSLYEKIKWVIGHPKEMKSMRTKAVKDIRDVWNPGNAARSLLQLLDDLRNDRDTSVWKGPCSKA